MRIHKIQEEAPHNSVLYFFSMDGIFCSWESPTFIFFSVTSIITYLFSDAFWSPKTNLEVAFIFYQCDGNKSWHCSEHLLSTKYTASYYNFVIFNNFPNYHNMVCTNSKLRPKKVKSLIHMT